MSTSEGKDRLQQLALAYKRLFKGDDVAAKHLVEWLETTATAHANAAIQADTAETAFAQTKQAQGILSVKHHIDQMIREATVVNPKGRS